MLEPVTADDLRVLLQRTELSVMPAAQRDRLVAWIKLSLSGLDHQSQAVSGLRRSDLSPPISDRADL